MCFKISANDTFELDKMTGELKCTNQLDRESVDQFVIHVRAVPQQARVKRSFGGMYNQLDRGSVDQLEHTSEL